MRILISLLLLSPLRSLFFPLLFLALSPPHPIGLVFAFLPLSLSSLLSSIPFSHPQFLYPASPSPSPSLHLSLEEYFQVKEARNLGEALTGLMLIYPKYCHMVWELPFDEVEHLLALARDQQRRGLLEQVSIVHLGDICDRAFRTLAHRLAVSEGAGRDLTLRDSQCLPSELFNVRADLDV